MNGESVDYGPRGFIVWDQRLWLLTPILSLEAVLHPLDTIQDQLRNKKNLLKE